MRQYQKISALLVLILTFVISNTLVLAKPRVSGTVPIAPTNLTASNITTSSATLSWSAASNATGYKLYRATPNDSNYALIATLSSTSYSNTGLTAGTKYWYYVTAYNSYGTSASSTHINLTTAQAPVTTPKKLVLGFTTYYYSGDTSSYNSMKTNTSTIDEIATQSYVTDAAGKVTGLVPTNQLTYANSTSIKSLAMIQNNFDKNISKAVLESATNRQALINNMLNIIKTNGYKGINVDIEGVYYYDRNYLTTFMSELYNTLKPLGYTVTMSVPAKTYDNLTDSWSGAFDYASLSKYADQIVLMTYDEHYPGGTSGPVASIGWVENVVKYAVTVIPSSKLLLGTAAYGYDWSSNGTKAYGINSMFNLASANGTAILWDATSKTPYFNYTDSTGIAHSAWFENGTSVGYKLDLVNNYNLSGIAIWRLGLENTDYWSTIKTKFNR
ncbi:glycosyl hydrolase family 18 protein [Clostridium felsineum]|uniref:Uncharacterized protein n=1 Tax=Clostridium felsineum TaxID=36839 RepID=A0A1S8L0M1_9CLOT|nr:glycosyl hydrolase family 18 protein [Clostridium felsineum]URZ09176.1 hypothetical protein CLROS_045920 [Clostridium felsineum]URZ13862.1 hypothetical protein CROST_046400 [Clostridium felsineum]